MLSSVTVPRIPRNKAELAQNRDSLNTEVRVPAVTATGLCPRNTRTWSSSFDRKHPRELSAAVADGALKVHTRTAVGRGLHVGASEACDVAGVVGHRIESSAGTGLRSQG